MTDAVEKVSPPFDSIDPLSGHSMVIDRKQMIAEFPPVAARRYLLRRISKTISRHSPYLDIWQRGNCICRGTATAHDKLCSGEGQFPSS